MQARSLGVKGCKNLAGIKFPRKTSVVPKNLKATAVHFF